MLSRTTGTPPWRESMSKRKQRLWGTPSSTLLVMRPIPPLLRHPTCKVCSLLACLIALLRFVHFFLFWFCTFQGKKLFRWYDTWTVVIQCTVVLAVHRGKNYYSTPFYLACSNDAKSSNSRLIYMILTPQIHPTFITIRKYDLDSTSATFYSIKSTVSVSENHKIPQINKSFH